MTTASLDVGAARAARAEVVRSMAASDWARASAHLDEAEQVLDALLARDEPDGATRDRLAEERALCDIHRADLAIRHWRVAEAEERLDAAYKVLKKGTTEAELWRVTARIAERRGRWSAARAAWKKVVKLTGVANEGVVADAELRLAELAYHDGNRERCDAHLARVDALGLDDALVRVRAAIVRADLLTLEGDIDAATEAWRDISRDLRELPQDFVALANLRRAGTEVHRVPMAAVKRVLRAAALLKRVRHPDALGMAYGQLAVLATALRRPTIGALAAVGANSSRTGDTIAHTLLAAALRQADVDLDLSTVEDRHLQEALVGHFAQPARELGIAWSDLGTAKGLEKLAEPLAAIGGAGVRVDVESGEVVRSPALVGHRSSLTWDAPLGVLRTVELAAPVVVPRRPALYRPPPSTPTPPAGIPATPPPTLPRTVIGRRMSPELTLLAVVTGVTVTGFGGLTLLVVWALAANVQPVATDERPVVQREVPTAPVFTRDEGDADRIEVSFAPGPMAVPVTLEGAGVAVAWTGGEGTLDLPPGTYVVRIGESERTIALEGASCSLRRLGSSLRVACD
jgi:tetratricopeptide (TPR) repeat protein